MKHCAGQIRYLAAIKELSELDEYVKCANRRCSSSPTFRRTPASASNTS